jgi:subfamily B ATP-binding cassette protein MsbA
LYRNFHLKAIVFWLKIHAIWQNVSFLQRLLVSFTQLSVFFLSILFIQKGEMTVGELVMFNAYAAMFFGPFVVLGRNWQTLQNGMAAIVRAEKILKAAPELYEPKDAVALRDLRGDVEFRGVTFSYERNGRATLQNISFKVNAGTSVALVGESGVGKTTLVDLISLYYRPTQGKIYIDGHNILRLNIRTLRSHIAIVPQDIVLFNDTIRNNIRYGRFRATDEEIAEAATAAHANEIIERFPHKYNQKVGERGMKLSSGQKQRIAIARAVLRDPKILILDEPTSSLDAKSEAFISESLGKLMQGRTTFIIAHRLSTVRHANVILVFQKGRIVERGTHDELTAIQGGVYRKLYELQIGLK